ncbi:DUF302 domain-containing protein [Flavobacteriaceae bacterium TP-CH-4]|uniref:DUF302 domain-containing protein n=1 Tax=Pelagihabitans pacificus TaxID=2696054 RepID=A0A967APQ5_9FLAO|nr:DUF302 domain-containing protein [Pelagihabitans pacificus]NHF57742.1 DUF302 domain-containing protein [Pelagihabitans pacificus]
MTYYHKTTLKGFTFDEVIQKTTEALKSAGFGILTEIDLKATFKKKLDADFYNYVILGACNPSFAYRALQSEDKIGTMLPCNVIVQEKEAGAIEVAAVNPMASMQAVQNEELGQLAEEVNSILEGVVTNIGS